MPGSCIGLKTTSVQKDPLLLLPSFNFPALQYETEKERTDCTLKGRMNDFCYQTQDIYLLYRRRLSMLLRRQGKRQLCNLLALLLLGRWEGFS